MFFIVSMLKLVKKKIISKIFDKMLAVSFIIANFANNL